MILRKYEEELDLIIERIITKEEAADGLDKGRAETACYFIAILKDPNNPDIVKAKTDALRRFKRAQQAEAINRGTATQGDPNTANQNGNSG